MSVTAYRGESSGILFDRFDLRQTRAGVGFFFSEDPQLAQGYAKQGTPVRRFHLSPLRVLDLTDPYTEEARTFIHAYSKDFDEWVDRHSGEEVADAAPWLDSGMLYDYEGTGSGTRWNTLFRHAHALGFDAVRVLDHTDGGGEYPVAWVLFSPEHIQFSGLEEPHHG